MSDGVRDSGEALDVQMPVEWWDVLHGRREGHEVARELVESGHDPERVIRDRVLFTPMATPRRRAMIAELVECFGSEDDGTELERTHAPSGAVPAHVSSVPRRWRSVVVVTMGLAAALLLGWWIREWSPAPADAPSIASLESRYDVTLEGGLRELRSTQAVESERLSTDGRVRLRIVPEHAVESPVQLTLFAYRGAHAVRLDVEPRIGEGGAMEIGGTVEQVLGLPAGDWTLSVVITPQGATTDDPELYRSSRSEGDTQVISMPITIVARTLEVDLAGCEVRRSHRCVVKPETTLRLWVSHRRAADAEILVDGEPAVVRSYEVEGEVGLGWEVDLPPLSTRVTVSLPAGLGVGAWTTPLISLDEANGAAQQQILSRVRELQGEAHAAQRVDAWERAVEHRTHAMRVALEGGLFSHGLDAGVAAAFLRARKLDDLAGAKAQLEQLEAVAEHDARGRAQLGYYQGLIAMMGGQTHQAAVALRQASRAALRLGDDRLALSVLPMFAFASIELGHYQQAARWSELALELSEAPCDRAANLRNLGWAIVLVGLVDDAEVSARHDPLVLMRRAHELYAPGGACANPRKANSARISLAVSAVELGLWDEVDAWLGGVERARLDSHELLWEAEASVRVRMARDTPEALEALERLEALASTMAAPSAHWRAALRRGEVMEGLGRVDDALEALEAAEALADEMAVLVELGLGRDLYVVQQQASARRLVALLIARGLHERAQCVARRARLRALPGRWGAAALDPAGAEQLTTLRRRYGEVLDAHALTIERLLPRDEQRERTDRARVELEEIRREMAALMDDGRMPVGCEGLPSVPPGELLLVLFPLGSELAVLTVDDQGFGGHVIAMPDDGLGTSILERVADRVQEASLLRVVAAGPALRVDIHAAQLHGTSILEILPVVYSADLVDVPARTTAATASPKAVVVLDPTGSLGSEAADEAEHVRRALGSGGWSARLIDGDTLEEVRLGDVVAEADVFHYAGHAAVGEDWSSGEGPSLEAGGHGWSDRLELGRGRRLDVGQILMMPSAPRSVVLMGCSTGLVDPRSSSGGMSLALAFLMAGSEAVIASSAPIDNVAASRLARELYDDVSVAQGFDPVQALRRAQRRTEYTIDRRQSSYIRVWVR